MGSSSGKQHERGSDCVLCSRGRAKGGAFAYGASGDGSIQAGDGRVVRSAGLQHSAAFADLVASSSSGKGEMHLALVTAAGAPNKVE